MKTSIRLFNIISSALAGFVLSAGMVMAESDRDYETSLRERKRDFESYIKERDTVKSDIAAAAAALRLARQANERELKKNESAYQKTMKRYSMEEAEARDLADEERLAEERAQTDLRRVQYVVGRDKRRLIEASVGPLDPYKEANIDMKVEPETKVSHPPSLSPSGEETGAF